MNKTWFLAIFLVFSVSIFAQTRADIKIYIPSVRANAEQAAYFEKNFAMEITGAGYTLTDNPSEADYSLALEVRPNMILYEDGKLEAAPPDEKQFVLEVVLIKNEDKSEMVTFSFPFNDLDEMYDFNLYLLYEALANVPFTKKMDAEEDDFWRNKWLYARASFDYPVTFYELQEPNALWSSSNPSLYYPLYNYISPNPAATIGIELQYLYWMSTELDFHFCFGDPLSNSLIPTITLEQKFPIKPGKIYMVEPYLAVSFPMITYPDAKHFPKVGVGGGFQLGVKGGSMGAFFVDVNYIHFLGDVVMKSSFFWKDAKAEDVIFQRWTVGLAIGYKIGFFDRPPRSRP